MLAYALSLCIKATGNSNLVRVSALCNCCYFRLMEKVNAEQKEVDTYKQNKMTLTASFSLRLSVSMWEQAIQKTMS